MQLAFYKGNGNLFDKAVRVFTYSPYSHCELVFSDGAFFSADPRSGGVRYKRIPEDPETWDFVDIKVDTFDEGVIRRWCNKQVGKGYDWWGILFSQVFPFGSEDPNRFFCSEVCVDAIKRLGRLKILSSCESNPKSLAVLYGLIKS